MIEISANISFEIDIDIDIDTFKSKYASTSTSTHFKKVSIHDSKIIINTKKNDKMSASMSSPSVSAVRSGGHAWREASKALTAPLLQRLSGAWAAVERSDESIELAFELVHALHAMRFRVPRPGAPSFSASPAMSPHPRCFVLVSWRSTALAVAGAARCAQRYRRSTPRCASGARTASGAGGLRAPCRIGRCTAGARSAVARAGAAIRIFCSLLTVCSYVSICLFLSFRLFVICTFGMVVARVALFACTGGWPAGGGGGGAQLARAAD